MVRAQERRKEDEESRDKSLEPQAADAPARDESPPWVGVDSSHLPDEYEKSVSLIPQDRSDDDVTPSDLEDGPHIPLSQVTNARSPRWQSWQDRYLAKAVDQTRPFLLPPSDREEGWNRTAELLLRDSSAVGDKSVVDRTGSACKNRFMKLMKEHKKGEAESRMKTGEVEEVSEHLKLMTELQAIMNDHEVSAKDSSAKSKRKAAFEEEAGKQLRDAAMKGLAQCEGLIDVSELDGASVREKQGQRKRPRPPVSPRFPASDDHNSDVEPPPKRRTYDILQKRTEQDTRRLDDARECADRQHEQPFQPMEPQDTMHQGLCLQLDRGGGTP
ncbi:hypothetical protein C8R45DRAFT_1033891 [Mycena sanguinolenta]|nr:hypothetical protein C8R45DRAFT_1033891 [Mycena sanguinolenta]